MDSDGDAWRVDKSFQYDCRQLAVTDRRRTGCGGAEAAKSWLTLAHDVSISFSPSTHSWCLARSLCLRFCKLEMSTVDIRQLSTRVTVNFVVAIIIIISFYIFYACWISPTIRHPIWPWIFSFLFAFGVCLTTMQIANKATTTTIVITITTRSASKSFAYWKSFNICRNIMQVAGVAGVAWTLFWHSARDAPVSPTNKENKKKMQIKIQVDRPYSRVWLKDTSYLI